MATSHGMRRFLCLACSCFLASATWGEEGQDNPILDFASCTADATVLGSTYIEIGALDKAGSIFTSAKKCMDTLLPLALYEAANNPDLTSAVKDFYVKATTWANAASDSRRARLARQPFDEALNRLRMEAMAAGKWGSRPQR